MSGIPRQIDPHGGFDTRRNSSRVFPVERGASQVVIKMLHAARDRRDDWYVWVTEEWPKVKNQRRV